MDLDLLQLHSPRKTLRHCCFWGVGQLTSLVKNFGYPKKQWFCLRLLFLHHTKSVFSVLPGVFFQV